MLECQSHDRTKGPQDQEEISKDISALLAEYSAIKAEEAACEQTQITLATSLFSFIAAIFGLNCFFAKNVDTNAVQFMILGLCPPMIMFFGVLWMYQLYCHMRFGAYLYHIEEDVNKCCPNKNSRIYFDHWIVEQEEKHKCFLFKTSWLYGCITLGTWLFVPILLIVFTGCFFPDWNIMNFYFVEHRVLTLFLGFVSSVYYYTQLMYVHAIRKLKSEKELGKPRILK